MMFQRWKKFTLYGGRPRRSLRVSLLCSWRSSVQHMLSRILSILGNGWSCQSAAPGTCSVAPCEVSTEQINWLRNFTCENCPGLSDVLQGMILYRCGSATDLFRNIVHVANCSTALDAWNHAKRMIAKFRERINEEDCRGLLIVAVNLDADGCCDRQCIESAAARSLARWAGLGVLLLEGTNVFWIFDKPRAHRRNTALAKKAMR